MEPTHSAPDREKSPATGTAASAWPEAVYRTLREGAIEQVAYVPDAGHSRLIEMMHADGAVHTTVLTTEEEGVAVACGAWLGGQRAVLLTQSSGVGNCVNMLALAASCRFPLLMLVTMRGEWAEFNPWQLPMGGAVRTVLEAMGVRIHTVDRAVDAGATVAAALTLAFEAEQQVAVLLSQRMLGRKVW